MEKKWIFTRRELEEILNTIWSDGFYVGQTNPRGHVWDEYRERSKDIEDCIEALDA